MKKLTLSLLLGVLSSLTLEALAEDPSISQLANLEIEDLMNQEVSSVLRKDQPLSNAPAAIYVISQEDIRRSGSRNLPELLRMVPGITVARSSSGNWQITARGFDSNGSSKLLVLIDGRSVYSPAFSGVFWDAQDLIAEDIERIEVIRGPGAVSWGENAVNGVINVITKNSSQTLGWRVIGAAANQGSSSTSVTFGDKVGKDTFYRVFAKYFNRDGLPISDSSDSEGKSDLGHGGFRMDTKPSSTDTLTFQGDVYKGERNEGITLLDSFTPPFTSSFKDTTILSGGNVLLRWTHELEKDSEVTVQTYYDRTNRQNSQFGEGRDTYDLDVQHHVKLSETHDFVYGADFRSTSDDILESFALQVDPDKRTDVLANVFVQDEITIMPKTFDLIPGVKLGYNDYSQFDYQPGLKAVWTPNSKNTVWGSIARAVRSPARIDEDVKAYTQPTIDQQGNTIVPTLLGSKDFDAEQLLAYEVGYRTALSKTVSFDISTYYHDYSDLLSIEPGSPFIEGMPTPVHVVQPFFAGNNLHGSAYGFETTATWVAAKDFDLSASYSYINLKFNADAGITSIVGEGIEDQTPNHQATLKAHWDLTDRLELNSILYFVDAIEAFDVPAYVRTDLHLGYKLSDAWQFDFAVSNMTDQSHREWETAERGVDVQRAVSGKLTYSFK